jgi:4'-phosphopantetheinyl transferase
MSGPTLDRLAAPRGVDLWSVPLGGPAARDARLIAGCSPREHARAARMPLAGRRRAFLVGRGIVRSVLGAYLAIAPGDVEIGRGPHGKPFIDAPDAPAFSVSHSGDLLVLAVTAAVAVGVDVERVDAGLDVMAIASRFLASQERAQLARLTGDDRQAAFFAIWTRKEAHAKASGSGLSVGLAELRATSADAAQPRWDGRRTLVDIDPAPGYVGALAYDAPSLPVHTPEHAPACL